MSSAACLGSARRYTPRLHAGVLSVLVAVGVLVAAVPGGGARADTHVERVERRVRGLKHRIRARREALASLTEELDRLAVQTARTRVLLERTRDRMRVVERELAAARERNEALVAEMDQRSRNAFMQVEPDVLLMVLESDSFSDLMSGIDWLSHLNQQTGEAAALVEGVIEDIEFKERLLDVLEWEQSHLIEKLAWQEREMRKSLIRQKRLLAFLFEEEGEAAEALARLKPFSVCPVDGPHFVTDSFGAPRKGHIHEGDDIMSPHGTPIVAPFAGEAVAGRNKLGGLTVNVYGPFGYVYNAHLSRLGTLGRVTAGTVIGYVGVSGNAAGPHLHFEWHPGNVAAIDPYGFLTLVC